MRTVVILAALASVAGAGGWYGSLERAKRQAVRDDKLIFIDFTADW